HPDSGYGADNVDTLKSICGLAEVENSVLADQIRHHARGKIRKHPRLGPWIETRLSLLDFVVRGAFPRSLAVQDAYALSLQSLIGHIALARSDVRDKAE